MDYLQTEIDKLTHEIESVIDYIDIIDNLEFLEALYAKIYHRDHLKRVQRGINLYSPIPTNYIAELVWARIIKLTPQWYKADVFTSQHEIVNGYALRNSSSFCEVSYCEYKKLCKLWDDTNDLTYDEFVDEFEEKACTDWNKVDDHGESFGGFWKSTDPEIKENAYHLMREHNREKLWKLPFPKRFLLHTMEIGCSRRQESVKDSNHMGVWFERKRALEPKS